MPIVAMSSLVLRSSLVVVAVLAFRCLALEDEPDMTQREVDFSKILGEKGISQLDHVHDVTQREMTFGSEDLWEHIELPEAGPDFTQREVTFDLPKILRERGSRRGEPDMTQREVTPDLDGHFEEIDWPMLVPRSSKLDMSFPPARPSFHNFPAICLYGEDRSRYPPSSLPQTGFSHLQRQGDAINRVESLYSFCCQKNGTQGKELSLCCAQQAWEYVLNGFCEEEFSIKTAHYHCCKKRGGARWSCFEKEGRSFSYQPTSKGSVALKSDPEPGFTWDPNTCQRASLEPRGAKEPKVPDISFPPGRPTPSNIGRICRLRKLRPRYNLKCLPSNSYGWLERQSKAINRMEKAIKQCCKGQNEVACANGKWKVVMDRYCAEEHSVKDSPFPCCDLPQGPDRYSCLSSHAPHPRYDREMLQHEVTHVTLKPGLICDTHKLLTKKFSVPFPVKSLVSQCCHLPAAQRTACVQGKLDDLMERMCTGKEPLPPAVSPDCCMQTSHGAPNCLFKLLEEAAIKATKFSALKKKCPLV
ncbi:extracellular matrix protein 1 [Conger conger]|uniref:extracellular matrix protein 1 n=1 Tax=Conger conger TaxID=82655 RepID=UPI002A5AE52E|nr:extracellular matrix protein 1 [Conger conger]